MASMGWWNLKRADTEDGDASPGSRGSELGNWWPGIGPWRMGIKMESATITFPAGENWIAP
jgi:hypothetical protein